MSRLISLQHSVEFADNPEPRCPCVLLLDTSQSMTGAPIDELNRGLAAFRDDIVQDSLAARRVEVAIVTFGGQVLVAQDFVTADEFDPPTLMPRGQTPLGGAVLRGLDLIESRKVEYRRHGIEYYRPWCFLITDGKPQGEAPRVLEDAAARVLAEDAAKRIAFFSVGVQGADMVKLDRLSLRKPMPLKGLNFVNMFLWLSRSTQAVSQSRIGMQEPLPSVDWSTA